jgi:hypothetical protein
MNNLDIRKLKNIHQGKRAFFIGNGPSLRISDLELLNDEITFGCNKIYLAFGQTDWRPTYYSITDRLSAKTNSKTISSIPSIKLFGDTIKSSIDEEYSNFSAYWFHHISRPKDNNNNYIVKFSKDASKNTYGGHNVLYFQFQIAYYMGISEVVLLGVDFNYKLSKSTGVSAPNGEVLIGEGETNHFHPNYREIGEKWIKPEKEIQSHSFNLASEHFINNGRNFLNASRYTELEGIKRVPFDQIVG